MISASECPFGFVLPSIRGTRRSSVVRMPSMAFESRVDITRAMRSMLCRTDSRSMLRTLVR